ncbi:hypothetical protein D9M72_641380 [compost metagenome]
MVPTRVRVCAPGLLRTSMDSQVEPLATCADVVPTGLLFWSSKVASTFIGRFEVMLNSTLARPLSRTYSACCEATDMRAAASSFMSSCTS